jgi:hypothetical protein
VSLRMNDAALAEPMGGIANSYARTRPRALLASSRRRAFHGSASSAAGSAPRASTTGTLRPA